MLDSRLRFRLVPLAAVAVLAAAASACAPTIGSHGFQAVETKPADIVAGTDTRETVLARLGSPSATSTFESDQVWYYITQFTEKYTYNRPQVSQRTVTEITFAENSDQVLAVRTLDLSDAQDLAMNGRETPTRGRQLSVIEQLLGNVGRGQLQNTERDTPGQRRPD